MIRHALEDESESGLCLCVYPWKNTVSLLIHAEVSKLVIKDAEEVVKGHLYGVKSRSLTGLVFTDQVPAHHGWYVFFNHI